VLRAITTMNRISHGFLILLIAVPAITCHAQEIHSTYADLTISGSWQSARPFVAAQFGADIYYDAGTGAVVVVNQQPGMQRVTEISKFFTAPKGASKDAAEVMSEAAFPLPFLYTEKASKDLAKGTKPPKIGEVKDGEGNPLWFYTSLLFDGYQVRDAGGASEVREEYLPVRVMTAEQRSVSGGDALLFGVESEKPATEAVVRHFHMPPGFKDQRVRYGWIQFAPGGIGSGQGVLSVAFAASADSKLTIDYVLSQVASAKLNPL
jgi:hypothetical protein